MYSSCQHPREATIPAKNRADDEILLALACTSLTGFVHEHGSTSPPPSSDSNTVRTTYCVSVQIANSILLKHSTSLTEIITTVAGELALAKRTGIISWPGSLCGPRTRDHRLPQRPGACVTSTSPTPPPHSVATPPALSPRAQAVVSWRCTPPVFAPDTPVVQPRPSGTHLRVRPRTSPRPRPVNTHLAHNTARRTTPRCMRCVEAEPGRARRQHKTRRT